MTLVQMIVFPVLLVLLRIFFLDRQRITGKVHIDILRFHAWQFRFDDETVIVF